MGADGPSSRFAEDISLVPETASDSAVRHIRAMIFSGELGPGDRLPPERDLGAPGGSPSLRMDFKVTPDAWEITVCDPDGRRRILPASPCDPMSEGGLGLTIIKALVDSVELTDSDTEGSVLRLVKRLSAGPVFTD